MASPLATLSPDERGEIKQFLLVHTYSSVSGTVDVLGGNIPVTTSWDVYGFADVDREKAPSGEALSHDVMSATANSLEVDDFGERSSVEDFARAEGFLINSSSWEKHVGGLEEWVDASFEGTGR